MRILVSGLLNTETTTAVRGFPVNYYPIDYPFFGIDTGVSGVAFNVAKALRTLGDDVRLASMVGRDYPAAYIRSELDGLDISTEHVLPELTQTPSSVVLYDPQGRRQIYCELKDIQETSYPFREEMLADVDLVAACNINFNRPLLRLAKGAGKRIATDVHVLSDIHDGYNREFMECADILFLSDEGIGEDYGAFLWQLAHTYGSEVIVLGRGARGAAIYRRETDDIRELEAVKVERPVNTVGAGDSFISGFLYGILQGWPVAECLSKGAEVSAQVVQVFEPWVNY